MKIHIDLPWGGVLHIEKQPMDDDLKMAFGVGVFFICLILVLGFVAK